MHRLITKKLFSFHLSSNSNSNDSDDSDVSTEDVGDRINESNESTNSSDNEDEQFDRDDDSSSSSSSDNGVQEDFSSLLQPHDIGVLLNKCRSIVSTIRKSSILHELVRTIATDSSIDADVIIDMRIRWNSTYRMIHRILAYQAVFDQLYEQMDDLPGVTNQQKKRLLDSKLRGNDWNLIQALRRVLERFDEATKILSGQTYCTLSISYAVVFSLFHYLSCRSGDQVENEIKGFLLSSFDQYMVRRGEEFGYIRVAALLDPLTHDLLTSEDKHCAESFIIKEVIIQGFFRTK